MNKYNFKICDNNHVNSKIIIRDIATVPTPQKFHVKYNCDVCGIEYDSRAPIRRTARRICECHKFFYDACDYCGKEFEIIRLSDFITSEKDLRFCSNNCALQYRNRTKEMKEAVVAMNVARVSKNLSKSQVCKKCGNNFFSIFPMNVCNSCIASETNKRNSNIDQVCEICGKIFNSTFIMKICLYCNPNMNVSSFNEHGEYWDKTINEYVPWEKCKKKFKVNNIAVDTLPDNFEFYPTFRTQDSDDWSNASQAFERSLVEASIGWFVYIKFYIDRNSNDELVRKPLVVGKTGSKLVNKSGTDVCFSTDISDGPARRFLSEENLDWDKTVIAICKCESELEAYQLESEIEKCYNLFRS